MPLRLLESVLPWLVGSLSEEEARSFLYNMHMAGLISFSLFFSKLVVLVVCAILLNTTALLIKCGR